LAFKIGASNAKMSLIAAGGVLNAFSSNNLGLLSWLATLYAIALYCSNTC